MTPQLLVNNIKRADEWSVRIDDFTLLVFDECHHAMGFSSYNNIMACYRRKLFKHERPNINLPQVIKQNSQSISHRSLFPLTCNSNCYYIA